MTIGTKLGLSFAAIILLMLASGVIVYVAVENMNQSAGAVFACQELLNGVNHSAAALRGGALMGRNVSQRAYYTAERKQAWQNIQGAFAAMSAYYENSADPQDAERYATIRQQLEPLQQAQDAVEELIVRDVEAGADQGGSVTTALTSMETTSAPLVRAVAEALEALKDSGKARLDSARRLVSLTLLITTLTAVSVGVVVATLLQRHIVSSVRGLLRGVESVAAGDLTGAIQEESSRDEIGQLSRAFQQMVTALRRILAEANTASADIATASAEIAAGAQQQLASLNQTATSLNEITATAEEFKATMQEFADRARAVLEASDETTQRAVGARALSRDSAERIEQVRGNAQASGESVLGLSEQMQRIGEITATVNEIAEQTKLLALNASIEAARAGDDGRGFAVVATQVRELANQSKGSAVRIESLVADTQKSMQEVVRRIQEGGQLSENSFEMVRRVSRAFKQISEAMEQTREAMAQINSGAGEQERGISQLVSSIAQIDTASKESLAAAAQTQKSIVSIDQRIQALNRSIARFKT